MISLFIASIVKMKTKRHIRKSENNPFLTIILSIIVIFGLNVLFGCQSLYPEINDLNSVKPESISLKSGYISLGKEKIPCDYGILYVPENRSDDNTRTIAVPFMRLHSYSAAPLEPVFILNGGPGMSNLKLMTNYFLLNHEIVLIGYRGVDGPVQLKAPEVEKVLYSMADPDSEKTFEKIAEAFDKTIRQYKNMNIDYNGYNPLEITADIECLRQRLGYDKINLYSSSFGTRIAYIYSIKFAENVNRSFLIAVGLPGVIYGSPRINDEKLFYYNELWKNDPSATEKSVDIINTIQKVSERLKKGKLYDPGFLKLLLQGSLNTPQSASQVFSAFIEAEKGNYIPLSAAREILMQRLTDYDALGARMLMFYTSVRNPDEYETDNSEGFIIGNTLGNLELGWIKYSIMPVEKLPPELRNMDEILCPALLVSGSLDLSTNFETVEELILPYYINGQHIIIRETGHGCIGTQHLKIIKMAGAFLKEGIVDDSEISYETVEF